MAKGKYQKHNRGNPVALVVGICAVIVVVCLVGTLLLLKAPEQTPAAHKPSVTQPNATLPAGTNPTIPGTTAPTEEITQPTEEVTEPTEEVTEPTEEVTEPTEEGIVPDAASAFGLAVAELARAQKDKPYLHGGAGPDAFDTSGLVYYCFKENGLSVSRLVSGLAAGGEAVEKDALLPGDVVFFWTEQEGQPEYVGIYLGEGKFIAARHGDKPAAIMDLSAGYFAQRFVCARRYQPENKD